jgi:hypothetical protein
VTKSINDLRDALFETLQGVKDGSLDIEKAKAINEVAKSIVETAKVEVDYLRVTGGGESTFIDSAIGASNLPPGINGVVRHRLAG